MLQVTLRGAFAWECPDCGSEQFERATEGSVDVDYAEGVVSEHYETLDARYHDSDYAEADELVTRVLLGPAFVKCSECGSIFAARLPSDDLVSVGDTIECIVSNPRPRTMQVTISTPEACTKANVLVATGRWWKV